MKTTPQSLGLAAILTLLANTAVNAACSTRSGVTTTFYGYPDNDPPGPATAYNCGRNFIAGGITSGTAPHVTRDFDGAPGVGTYNDPLTFASASGEFSSCEVIYFPYLKKYLRYEDYCDQCTTDWKSGIFHIDIWTGSSTVNGGNNQKQCEDDLTPNPQSIVRQPPNNLPVDSTALYANGQCQTSHTYNNAPASCSGGGGTTPPPTCSWVGHCLGASCTSENDCSDNLVCNGGKCANP